MPNKITIEWLEDLYECEQCGPSSSYGAKTTIYYEDKPPIIILQEPIAHCYNGVSYNERDVLHEIIDKLGFELEELPNYD